MAKPKQKALTGRIFERTIHGGWEKVRGDAPDSDMKHYGETHRFGQHRGKPRYKFVANKAK